MPKRTTIDSKTIPPSKITDSQIKAVMRDAMERQDSYTEALCRIALGQDWESLRKTLDGIELAELLSLDDQMAKDEVAKYVSRES